MDCSITCLAVADLDGNGVDEVVVGCSDGAIIVLGCHEAKAEDDHGCTVQDKGVGRVRTWPPFADGYATSSDLLLGTGFDGSGVHLCG